MEKRLRQYKEMKAKAPDVILLFRSGAFYILFGQDAVDCKPLGLNPTKDCNGVAMAGFTVHELGYYMPKLLGTGRRVAVCDQLR